MAFVNQPRPQANSRYASERKRLRTERDNARPSRRSSSGDVTFDPAPRTTGNEGRLSTIFVLTCNRQNEFAVCKPDLLLLLFFPREPRIKVVTKR